MQEKQSKFYDVHPMAKPVEEKPLYLQDDSMPHERRQPTGKIPGVPVEKVDEMKAYTLMLHTKFPNMKPARVARKVSEKFNIKIV